MENKYRFHPLSFPPTARNVALPSMAAKQRKWKSKKNTVSSKKKRTTHPQSQGSHPLTTPDDDSDGDLNCELRTAKWELGTTSWQVGTAKGKMSGRGSGMGTLQRLLSGARQRKAATIKILKIYHWKNGRKKRRTRTRNENEVNSVHHFRGHVVFCFCFLANQAREEGGDVFALQTFLFNFSIFINFLA